MPIHVHVINGDGEAKFEIDEVKLVSNKGIKPKDIKLAEALIEENKEIKDKWFDYHGGK